MVQISLSLVMIGLIMTSTLTFNVESSEFTHMDFAHQNEASELEYDESPNGITVRKKIRGSKNGVVGNGKKLGGNGLGGDASPKVKNQVKKDQGGKKGNKGLGGASFSKGKDPANNSKGEKKGGKAPFLKGKKQSNNSKGNSKGEKKGKKGLGGGLIFKGKKNQSNNPKKGNGEKDTTSKNSESKTSSKTPTKSPTAEPTEFPTKTPTKEPTVAPTESPTASPTMTPTKSPTKSPTKQPTKQPTKSPTRFPTKSPTMTPTRTPTKSPTNGAITQVIPPTAALTSSPTYAFAATSSSVSSTQCEIVAKLEMPDPFSLSEYGAYRDDLIVTKQGVDDEPCDLWSNLDDDGSVGPTSWGCTFGGIAWVQYDNYYQEKTSAYATILDARDGSFAFDVDHLKTHAYGYDGYVDDDYDYEYYYYGIDDTMDADSKFLGELTITINGSDICTHKETPSGGEDVNSNIETVHSFLVTVDCDVNCECVTTCPVVSGRNF